MYKEGYDNFRKADAANEVVPAFGFEAGDDAVLLLCGLMIPPQVILLPITQMLDTLHLMATIQGLILFNVGYYIPFGVFLFSGFMRQIPGNSRSRRPSTGRAGSRRTGA